MTALSGRAFTVKLEGWENGMMNRSTIAAFAAAGVGLGLAAMAAPAPVWAQGTATPGQVFRDCAAVCPEMVVVPAGTFMMGAPAGEESILLDDVPRHSVTLSRAFAVGRYEVTFIEWDACATEGGCRPPAVNGRPEVPGSDADWGRGRRPAIHVSWEDAQRFVGWLSQKTGQHYRLLSEAEWEYAARAGTTTRYYTGNTITEDDARFTVKGDHGTLPVGSFAANAFGLHDMQGNVMEWVQDCRNRNYWGAPINGSAWTSGDCSFRITRGGAWSSPADNLRSARRGGRSPLYRWSEVGFRVARTL